jgi:hypothetical protein
LKPKKLKHTEGLVYAEKCLECIKECKIEVLPGAKLVKCPDFKKNPDLD